MPTLWSLEVTTSSREIERPTTATAPTASRVTTRWVARSKIRNHGSTRHSHLKRRYGISAKQADEMLEAQGGLCAICRAQPAEHVDHDHRTRTVRALLCFNCNGGLGQFKDDRDRLQAAIAYLDEHDPEQQELAAIAVERVRALADCSQN